MYKPTYYFSSGFVLFITQGRYYPNLESKANRVTLYTSCKSRSVWRIRSLVKYFETLPRRPLGFNRLLFVNQLTFVNNPIIWSRRFRPVYFQQMSTYKVGEAIRAKSIRPLNYPTLKLDSSFVPLPWYTCICTPGPWSWLPHNKW